MKTAGQRTETFRSELMRPRLSPFIAALATVLIGLALANRRLSLETLRGLPLPSALASETDDVTKAMWEIASQSDMAAPALIAVGASAMREAFEDDDIVAARLRAADVHPRSYIPLITSGQTLTESLALLTSMQAPAGSIVLIQLTPTRLSLPVGTAEAEVLNPRFPLLDYAEVRRLLRDVGHSVYPSPGLLRARGWLFYYATQALNPRIRDCLESGPRGLAVGECLRRISSDPWVVHPAAFRQHMYDDVALPRATKEQLARRLALQLVGAGESALDFGALAAARIDTECRKKGWKPVWVRLPIDSSAIGAERTADLAIDTLLSSPWLPAAAVVDLRHLPLPDDAFYDIHHVRRAGRAAIIDSLVPRAVALFGTSHGPA